MKCNVVNKCVFAMALTTFALTTAVSAQPTDFAHEVVPILRRHCVECHGGREAKGSFSMNNRELLIGSGHVEPGRPEDSHLLTMILSKDPESQMPPRDRDRLSDKETAVLRAWIQEGAVWDDGISFAPTAYEPPLLPRRPELPPAVDGRENPIDRLLDAELAHHQQPRPQPISDAAFLRRVHLDLIGLLPTPDVLDEFVADPSVDKRSRMIRRLLDDEISYADHWLTFFNDLLRNDYSGTGFITGGRQQVTTWLYEALLTNKPYDQLARELISPPTSASRGYIDGIRWRGEVSAGQTVEIQFAQSISQSFLGINIKCASCHDSFIDRWTLDEAYGLAAIYSTRPLEIHRCDKPIGRQAQAAWLFPELGRIDPDAPQETRLHQLADLMTHPDNGRFTRTIVNRIWYKLMGRGIVHPLDAMQTEPWNADLLDWLAVSLTDHNYDLKSVMQLIAESHAYQSACVVRTEDTSTGYVYRGPLPRRMTAEQFVDSVWQITGAAPKTIDARVFRAVVDPNTPKDFVTQGRWIWAAAENDSAAGPGGSTNAPAGESIVMRKIVPLEAAVVGGGAVVTCDNEFTLFINGREIDRGNNWQEPRGIPLNGLLNKGDNQIVVVAVNGGSEPNPAGFFFESQMVLANGDRLSVSSDDSWQFSRAVPNIREGRLGKIAGDWEPVRVLSAIPAWTDAVNSRAQELLAQVSDGRIPMVRASLVKSDFLMRSLGRPLREQIVSMRPTELTTLEAIDLTNEATFASALSAGAKSLQATGQNSPQELIRSVYRFALSRDPSPEELLAVTSSFSAEVTEQEIEDFLWAVFMTPEFLLVR